MSEEEEILFKVLKSEMIKFDEESFKKTHPTLLKAIVKAMKYYKELRTPAKK